VAIPVELHHGVVAGYQAEPRHQALGRPAACRVAEQADEFQDPARAPAYRLSDAG
jgi:hypothetical protein